MKEVFIEHSLELRSDVRTFNEVYKQVVNPLDKRTREFNRIMKDISFFKWGSRLPVREIVSQISSSIQQDL